MLLIEPHDDTRLLYTCLFEEAGYAVHGVSDGIAAVSVAHQRLPDVIIMEMAVPGVEGFEILRRLREDPFTSNIPAVVATSLVHFDIPGQARASGAVLVLKKPIEPDTLLTEVDTLIMSTPHDRTIARQLRRSLLTLRELGKRFQPDDRAKERIRLLIDRLQVAVLALDDDGRYLAVSRGVSALTGYSRGELLGLSEVDAGLSLDGVPARPWAALPTTDLSNRGPALRDKRGNVLHIQAAFATLWPGFHAAAFAISDTTDAGP